MKTSEIGIKLITSFEGLELSSYLCPANVWTIGYGHTGPDVKPGIKIDKHQAVAFLRKDLAFSEKVVDDNVNIKLNQNQFDALVSFVFNVGENAFKSSTLLKKLNSGENSFDAVKTELPRWNKGDKGVLEGLTRRRSAEVELFCKDEPQPRVGIVDITAKAPTWLKKTLAASYELSNDQKAKIVRGRTIKNCKILDRKNKHTFLELGFGLGKWWIYDDHWNGLYSEVEINHYATQDDLKYLRNFPYFYQADNGREGWRQCQTSSIAMCLRYIDTPGINDDQDYLKIVNKYGDTTKRQPHIDALSELGVYAKFTQTFDADDIKEQINKGLPVVAGILHHGSVSHPIGGGHFIVISGYGENYWLVQDPYGELDLINGTWAKTDPLAGRNVHYSFTNMNPRLFVSGGADGWCWYGFKRLK